VLTSSREQNPPSQANHCSGTEEISHLLWNLKIHYHIHKQSSEITELEHNTPAKQWTETDEAGEREKREKKTKLCGFGLLANYADRATAASWQSSTNFCG
jgi:hypothetical protein